MMGHTVDAVIHDGTGILWMIVIPDDDRQLDDPSFNPPGGVQIRVPHSPVPGADPIITAKALHPHLNLRHAPAAEAGEPRGDTGASGPTTPSVI
jgi:hypothetical protein